MALCLLYFIPLKYIFWKIWTSLYCSTQLSEDYCLTMLIRSVHFFPTLALLITDLKHSDWNNFLGRVRTYTRTSQTNVYFSLPVTRAFCPTVDRGWLVDFWNLPVKWIFVALPIGMLVTLLFYYDHVRGGPGA